MRRHVWWIVAAGVVLAAGALVAWGRTRPSYDAYGWLVWGYQTLHLSLDLGGAPSWKPLPYLFTVPFALLGDQLEMWLWMVTAVALALAGSVFGGRIAYHVVAGDRAPRAGAGWGGVLERSAPWLAAGFAAASVLGLQDYMHYVLSVQSDPVIVMFTLAAVDSHLHGRRRWAFWLGVLAALGRPEAWCLLVPYSIYLWWRDRSLRGQVAGGWLLILFMWFGVPTITNDRPFVSAQLAMGSPRELRHDQITGTLHRFWDLYNLPLWGATVGTMIWAAVRRDRVVLGLGAAAAVWVVTEVAFALHGWPGLPRYMFEAGALCGVISGIGFGRLVASYAAVDRARMTDRTAARAGARRGLPRLAGPLLALVLVVWLAPYARIRYQQEHDDLRAQRARTVEINAMLSTFAQLGGMQHIRSCGQPVVNVEWASALAFAMHLDVGFVGYRPEWELRQRRAIVLFTSLPDGWQVLPHHIPASDRPACATLRASLILNRRHPDGQLIPGPNDRAGRVGARRLAA